MNTRLVGKTAYSGKGFSVEVKIIAWHDLKKGQRKNTREVDIQLPPFPDGEIITVQSRDIWICKEF